MRVIERNLVCKPHFVLNPLSGFKKYFIMFNPFWVCEYNDQVDFHVVSEPCAHTFEFYGLIRDKNQCF